jgi:hypothetical protein
MTMLRGADGWCNKTRLGTKFPARPSSILEIRDFVRRCLADSPLSEQDNREVGETVTRALL